MEHGKRRNTGAENIRQPCISEPASVNGISDRSSVKDDANTSSVVLDDRGCIVPRRMPLTGGVPILELEKPPSASDE